MRKSDVCICKNKGADCCAVTVHLISGFVFATKIVEFLYFLNPKIFCGFTARFVSNLVRNPKDRVSHEKAQMEDRFMEAPINFMRYSWYSLFVNFAMILLSL